MSDFGVAQLSGGTIDLIKKINYPVNLVPPVDMSSTKGFRLDIVDSGLTEITHQFDKDVYLSDISISCSVYDDLDYWELTQGAEKICETMYTLEPPVNGLSSSGFQIFPKIPADTLITFSFNNISGNPKIVWMTLGYMYKIPTV